MNFNRPAPHLKPSITAVLLGHLSEASFRNRHLIPPLSPAPPRPGPTSFLPSWGLSLSFWDSWSRAKKQSVGCGRKQAHATVCCRRLLGLMGAKQTRLGGAASRGTLCPSGMHTWAR